MGLVLFTSIRVVCCGVLKDFGLVDLSAGFGWVCGWLRDGCYASVLG